MSAPLAQLRQAARLSVTDHLGIFDHYVVLGRDVEHIAIKFGCDMPVVEIILRGYGETVSEESCGRLHKLSQLLVKEYIERFYPGIAAEDPQNDWITLDAYLDIYHPGWREELAKQRVNEKRRRWKGRGLY